MSQATCVTADAPYDTRFTARDYESMLEVGAFDDLRVELVGGVLEKMTPSHLANGECNARLAVLLYEACRETPARIAIDLAVRLSDLTVRAPDIAIVAPGAPDRRIPGAEQVSLAVEIADASLDRDLEVKAGEYAQAGIPCYWVVDLNGSVIHAMSEPEGRSYRRTSVYRFGEPVPVPGTGRTITLD